MSNIIKQPLKIHSVPKEFLKDKKFSYKLYLFLVTRSWYRGFNDTKGNKEIERYEYKLQHIIISKLLEDIDISKSTYDRQMKNKLYRVKIDELNNRHLYINSPKGNYINIPNELCMKIIHMDEMGIRVFIYLYNYNSKDIFGQTNDLILESIGYSANSNNNKNKLSDNMKKLIDLGLISREMQSNGLKKFYIYHNNKND